MATIRKQATLVPAFPERATPSIASVHVAYVVSPGRLDHTTDGFTRLWPHQQMHMPGHQHTGEGPAPVFQTCVMKPPQTGSIVIIREENRLRAVPALDDMHRNTRKSNPGVLGIDNPSQGLSLPYWPCR